MCEDEGAKLSLRGLTLQDLIYLRVDIKMNSPYLPILFSSLFPYLRLMGPMCFSGATYPPSPFFFFLSKAYWAFLLGPIKPYNCVSVFSFWGFKWAPPSLRPIICSIKGREDPPCLEEDGRYFIVRLLHCVVNLVEKEA